MKICVSGTAGLGEALVGLGWGHSNEACQLEGMVADVSVPSKKSSAPVLTINRYRIQ